MLGQEPGFVITFLGQYSLYGHPNVQRQNCVCHFIVQSLWVGEATGTDKAPHVSDFLRVTWSTWSICHINVHAYGLCIPRIKSIYIK